MFIKKESLWDLAKKKNLECASDDSHERTLIVVGNKSSGKSTMIQKFLDQNEVTKPTLALEYSFGRKSGRSLTKDICHIWELGGGVIFLNLLGVYLGKNKNTTLVLVLDLSTPETLWNVLEITLHTVHNILKKKETSEEFQQHGNKLEDSHEDKNYVTSFPIPLIIVGSKYDLFQNFNSEKRKIICRTLRQVAHSLTASLIFYSDKDPNLIKKLKEVFNCHGFSGSQWKGLNTDFNKPLLVPFGADSFAQLEINVNSLSQSSKGLVLLERFKHAFTSVISQDSQSEGINLPDDPTKNPNFKEPQIDLLRSEKDEELESYLFEKENKKRMAQKILSS